MNKKLAFFIYKNILFPFAFLLLQFLRPLLPAKLKEAIQDKNNLDFTNINFSEKPFWIHAASGEIEYAKPVMRELKRRFPEIPILVTYSSPSAKAILEKIPEIDHWMPVPWEWSTSVQKFISHLSPRALLFARTDVWPVLTNTVAKNKIPMILFSATFAENSSRLKGFGGALNGHAFNQLQAIHCVSTEDQSNVESLKLTAPIYVSGDTRFEQVFYRLAHPKTLKNNLMPAPEEFIFIAGSTWPEDERVLLPALSQMQGVFLKSIIAPHEVGEEHLLNLEEQITALGMKSVRYTEASEWKADEVLIIDRVGILAELYTWADVAFIGGSFKKQVHSVMEALAAGLPVLVGPHHKNNREALYYMKKTFPMGTIVQSFSQSVELANILAKLKTHQGDFLNYKTKIKNEVVQNQFATEKVLTSLPSK
ncbi:hypothetical protein BDW_08815 [Bdellovibrio bacteriovorus W]|nr:hypothetical protein BDW_08815 [Bdellovibrio bacteriovorus W]